MSPLYTVAFPDLAPVDRAWIEAFRRAHDPQSSALIEAHLTLVFGTTEVDEPVYVAHVAAIARSVSPFSLRCRYAMPGHGDGGRRHHVYLVPDEGLAAAARLHDALYTGPLTPHLRLDLPYIPHLTLATTPSAEEAKALCDELNRSALDVHAQVRGLVVGALEPGGFRTVATPALAGRPDAGVSPP